MNDKRRCLRFKLELPVCFKNTRFQKEFSTGNTLDVSATGLCFHCREEVEKGQEILLQVKLPAEERVVLRTKVVWVREIFGTVLREFRVGLRILEPMQFDEEKFVKFCAGKMLEFYGANYRRAE